MADKPTPQKPMGPRMSHLHSEPISMSFASPQQLAQLGAGGSLFPRLPLSTTNQLYTAMTNPGFYMSDASHQMKTAPAKITTTVATKGDSQLASSGPKLLQPLPSQEIDLKTFKGFKFVMLDGLLIETPKSYDEVSGTFRWEMCESQEDRCHKFMSEDCKNKRVFFISSGALGEKIISQIHDLPQVYAVYIYCGDVAKHKIWAEQWKKIRIVCNDDEKQLLPQFAVDVAQANVDWGDALLKEGTKEKAKEKFQLALDKLTKHAPNHDPMMDIGIRRKIEECR